MNGWDVNHLDLEFGAPQILSSSDDSRAIALALPAGDSLRDHQVHERAWISVLQGEVEITTEGNRMAGGPGLVVELGPGERHAVNAVSDARLLLLLLPWPGDGHPGSMSLEAKAGMREQAAERRERASAAT